MAKKIQTSSFWQTSAGIGVIVMGFYLASPANAQLATQALLGASGPLARLENGKNRFFIAGLGYVGEIFYSNLSREIVEIEDTYAASGFGLSFELGRGSGHLGFDIIRVAGEAITDITFTQAAKVEAIGELYSSVNSLSYTSYLGNSLLALQLESNSKEELTEVTSLANGTTDQTSYKIINSYVVPKIYLSAQAGIGRLGLFHSPAASSTANYTGDSTDEDKYGQGATTALALGEQNEKSRWEAYYQMEAENKDSNDSSVTEIGFEGELITTNDRSFTLSLSSKTADEESPESPDISYDETAIDLQYAIGLESGALLVNLESSSIKYNDTETGTLLSFDSESQTLFGIGYTNSF